MADFEWTIQPLVGLGPLRFGMTREEVGRAMRDAAVTALDDVFDGSKNEFRTMDLPVCNYIAGKLHAVDTNLLVTGVTLDGVDVYALDPRELLRRLDSANGGAKIGLGMVLFETIGVNTTGFYDAEDDRFWAPAQGASDMRGLGLFAVLPASSAAAFVDDGHCRHAGRQADERRRCALRHTSLDRPKRAVCAGLPRELARPVAML